MQTCSLRQVLPPDLAATPREMNYEVNPAPAAAAATCLSRQHAHHLTVPY